jgi:hypothetical protein
MPKTDSLPEKTISTGEIADVAKSLSEIHGHIAILQADEKVLKEKLTELCNTDRVVPVKMRKTLASVRFRVRMSTGTKGYGTILLV